MHTVQTAGLALATDLAPPERQPQVVGLMYVMQLIGMIGSALVLGYLLNDYSPGQLIRVVQAVAVTTLVLNVIALWKQEPRSRLRKPGTPIEHTFKQAWQLFCQGPHTLRRLLAVGLGTMAFTMEDVLLEPYGGEILNMSVSSTTLLSATLALGGLLGFAWASRVLGRGGDAYRMSGWGAWIGLPAFVAVIASGPLAMPTLFVLGIFLIGLGGGLFAHGTLTATMQLAPPGQIGLAMGAWGAVQATAAGVGMAAGGLVRDGVALLSSPVMGYSAVYAIEILLLAMTLWAMGPLLRSAHLCIISTRAITKITSQLKDSPWKSNTSSSSCSWFSACSCWPTGSTAPSAHASKPPQGLGFSKKPRPQKSRCEAAFLWATESDQLRVSR
jgi:BCD family chlorophyll transporter-like MFS transporter